MDTGQHDLDALLLQLGLPAGDDGLAAFVAAHRPLAAEVQLAEAPFWNRAQAQFLREAIAADAEWAEAVDELDALLRH